MTDKEIIKALEYCCEDTSICPEDCPYYKCKGDYIPCFEKMQKDALDLINRQQEIIANISKLIIDNTYPSFDKDGKPVSIWNADGYKQIEELLKTGCKKPVASVIRCGQCRNYIAGFCTRDINGRTNMFRMSENDYCSYGERKADNG